MSREGRKPFKKMEEESAAQAPQLFYAYAICCPSLCRHWGEMPPWATFCPGSVLRVRLGTVFRRIVLDLNFDF